VYQMISQQTNKKCALTLFFFWRCSARPSLPVLWASGLSSIAYNFIGTQANDNHAMPKAASKYPLSPICTHSGIWPNSHFFYLAHFSVLGVLTLLVERADLGQAYLAAAIILVLLYPIVMLIVP
jgi:hypothetical protein